MKPESVRLAYGQHKGKWLFQTPEPYKKWILANCHTAVQIRNCDIPIKGRRLSELKTEALAELADDELTQWEADLVADHLAERQKLKAKPRTPTREQISYSRFGYPHPKYWRVPKSDGRRFKPLDPN